MAVRCTGSKGGHSPKPWPEKLQSSKRVHQIKNHVRVVDGSQSCIIAVHMYSTATARPKRSEWDVLGSEVTNVFVVAKKYKKNTKSLGLSRKADAQFLQ